MSTLYIQYPQSGGGGGSTGSQTGVPYVVGPLDGAATNPQGGTIGSFTFYQQSATATFPGLVSSANQTFAGVKSFQNQTLFSDGTVASPGISFINEPSTGIFRNGAQDLVISIGSAFAIEMTRVGSQVNMGFGPSGTISPSANSPVGFNNSFSGPSTYTFANINTGATSATIFNIANGTTANFTTIENWAYTTVGYLSGGSGLFGNSNQTQLIIGSEFTSGFIGFTVGGRTLATERVRLNSGSLVLNGGIQFVMSSVTFTTQSTSGVYNFNIPVNSGITGQALLSQGGGSSAMVWGGLNQMVGSVSLASQTVGNLPLSQTSGSISLTTQVSGNLPLAQTSGSISLTGQVSGVLPVVNGGTGFATNTVRIGSITFSQATGGNTYPLAFPTSVGTSSWVLQSSNGVGSLSWAAALTNPMTSSGDMIIGSGSGVAQRLALGNAGQVLTVSSGTANQAWASTIGTPGVGMTVVGIPNGSFPTSGTIGEVNPANPGGTSAVGGSGAFINLFNGPGIALSPGDWDVEGTIVLTTGATTAANLITGAISLGSASLDLTTSGGIVSLPGSVVVSTTYYLPTGKRRISIGSTTSVYLVGRLIYTVAGGAQWGTDSYFIARRVR